MGASCWRSGQQRRGHLVEEGGEAEEHLEGFVCRHGGPAVGEGPPTAEGVAHLHPRARGEQREIIRSEKEE